MPSALALSRRQKSGERQKTTPWRSIIESLRDSFPQKAKNALKFLYNQQRQTCLQPKVGRI